MNKIFTKNIDSIKKLSKEHFEALYEISYILNRSEYEDSLIESVLDLIINAVNADRGLFARYDENKNEFSIISARNIKKENITDLSKFSSGILQEVINKKEPLLFHDAQSEPGISQFKSVELHQIKSVLGVPIIKDKIVWGVILVDSQLNRKDFTEANLLFLSFISNLVSLSLDRIIEMEKLRDERDALINQLQTSGQIPDMIGESKSMKEVAALVNKVAATDATVLILGESGTGKELVANAIHTISERREKPFIAQFCGSIPEHLLESELFGYKKGAFTGAASDKKGLLEVADGGTFFLDEIAEVPKSIQTKLLRVLENKEIIRLGDTVVRKIDIRLLAATNKNLQQMVEEGNFREDLYYRLNVFPIKIPPLRLKKDDVPLLVSHFIDQFSDKKLILQPNALKKLERYDWPGNVRQLKNVIRRAVILCDGDKILEEHIIWDDERVESDFTGTLKEFEKILVEQRLVQFKGNRTHAAKSLGVSVRWIQMKLKEYGLDI